MSRWVDQLSTRWIITILIFCGVFAVILFVWGAESEPGLWSSILSGLGAAFLSTVIALFISEIVLKPVLVRDLREMTSLSQRVADISMRDLGLANRVDWADLYRSAKEIDLVVISPTAWIERDLERVIDCTGRNSRVRVFLPEAKGEIENQVKEAESALKDSWKRRQIKDKRAELEVWFLAKMPTSFMARFDNEVVVAVDVGLPHEAKPIIYFHLGIDGTSDIQNWMKDRWEWANSTIDGTNAWASRKESPDAAEVRRGLGTKLTDGGTSS